MEEIILTEEQFFKTILDGNDYNKLLSEKEKIIKLKPITILDLKDYAYMCENGLPKRIKWEFIRTYIVTNKNKTIYELSEDFFNSSFRPIGLFEPPVSLINWILLHQ